MRRWNPWDLGFPAQTQGSEVFETVQSVHVCGEDIEILENLTYLNSVVSNDGGLSKEVVWWIGLAHSIMYSHNMSILHCWMKIRFLKS